MSTVAITGGTGFLGSSLIERLNQMSDDVVPLARSMRVDGMPEWSIECPIDVVIHAAARVHVMNESTSDPLTAYRKANVLGTELLARRAAKAGVKRFVFISSVKVNGEVTADIPFIFSDVPAPSDHYAVSKFEAEQALWAVAQETGLEVVIVRPPLVYGPGVRANFLKFMRLVKMGAPLPFGAIHNRRSMVALDNLVDLVVLCTRHHNAPGQVFMVSDDRDVSISELHRMLAEAMGKRSFLVPVPEMMISAAAALTGRSAVARRLIGSLQVDITHTKSRLSWEPLVSIELAINKTVAHFLSHHEAP